MKRFFAVLLVLLAIPAVSFAQRGGGPQGPQQATTPEPLKFRYMGPAPAGRIASVSGVPGDPKTWYLGSASGGVWKSTDSGTTFTPIFDDQPVAAIGSIAVAPTDPNIVWVGTGEPWVIRYADVMGDGVYVSKDAGATWKHAGLIETGRIARVLIHPTDPNIVYVCAEGRLTGPQPERGVFKTTDGGANWKRVLFVDEKTGCSGLSIDQKDPNTLLAGTWQVEEHTWAELSGGPGSAVYMTHDGGENWTKLGNGLPKSPVGKIDVGIAPSDSKRMYALIQTAEQGSLWRSDDGGTTWKTVSWDRSLIGRAGYYIRLAVNPQNPDDLIIMSSSMHRSVDAGKNFSGNGATPTGVPQGASCGDCHDVWFDPKDPISYALTDDGGANINTHNGQTRVSLPNGQMYHVHVDNRVPYWIYSNRQDDGTMRGPSTVSESTGSGCLPEGSTMPTGPAGGFAGRGGRGGGGGRGAAANANAPNAANAQGRGTTSRCAGAQETQAAANAFGGGGGGGGRGRGGAALQWQPNIGGCESGFTIPDPTNADVIYASCYGNKVTRWDAKTGTARSIEPWEISLDSPPDQAKYRCHWTAPMAIDPFDTKNVLYGCQLLLKTSNNGQSWTEFSPDLSTKDTSHVVSNGGLVGDNLGQYDGEVVWSIEVLEDQAGTDLGRHQRRQTVEHPRQRRALERRHEELQGSAAVGRVQSDLAVDVRCGHGVRRRFVPPDGRSQAVHVQDDGLRRDVDEDQRQHPDRASARLHPVDVGEPEQEGDAVCRQRARLLLLDGRRRHVDPAQGRPAAGARELDHRRAALPRRGDFDVRTRPLHPAEHHGARADRNGRDAGRVDRDALRSRADHPTGA